MLEILGTRKERGNYSSVGIYKAWGSYFLLGQGLTVIPSRLRIGITQFTMWVIGAISLLCNHIGGMETKINGNYCRNT